MPENNHAPDASGQIRVGDVSGTLVVGHDNTVTNLKFTAESGSIVTVHTGPPPEPVKRRPISQLPQSAADPLIGREREVRVLREAIGTRPSVQLWGVAGVGKSALLRHLACSAPHGPEGVAYIEAGGRTADDIAQAIFDVSFHAPNYKPSLEVLKEYLKTLRLRIYLDDVGLDEKDLRRLFDLAEQSTFVFTSQQRSAAGGVHAIQLTGLTAAAAAELVEALLGRELRPDEARTVAALCDAVDGSPLRLRRIASSAATGQGLPGIADLPRLLPALVNKLQPQERDLLHLLGSLSGAELAARQLKGLLGRPDTEALADGLVRHGLLLASETGYSCPPDVAEYVLTIWAAEFPAERLCRELTAWVQARDTTPDDVAAHFQALDVAVLRAEQSGHAELGVALARAASPKLALSRQFDAWGSLLGAGWAAANSVGDKEGAEFFLREARTRRRAIGRGALTTGLVLEADLLWRELTVLRAHAAAQQVVNAATNSAATNTVATNSVATTTAPPVHALPTTHVAGTMPTFTHPVPAGPVTPALPHAPVVKPVVDFSSYARQPQPAAQVSSAHATAHSTAQIPNRIDLSHAHTSATQPTHAVSTTTTATSTGHTPLTAAGAAGAKGGMSALAIACTVGFAVVVGVGATVYANDQPSPSPVVAAGSVSTPGPVGTPGPLGTPDLSDSTAPTVDPVCASVIPDLSSEMEQLSTDGSTVSDALDSYNSAMDDHNSGETTTVPDDSTLLSDIGTVISDLNSVESTLQGAISQAQDSSVEADLNSVLTPTQQMESQFQGYQGDSADNAIDVSSQTSAMSSALDSLQTDCGD